MKKSRIVLYGKLRTDFKRLTDNLVLLNEFG